MKHLLRWKSVLHRKPLILRGARQVGKSWLVRELGKTFDNFIEINFERNPDFCHFFNSDLDPVKITKNLVNYINKEISAGKTLLFLDEIQACPRAIISLRYFYEEHPKLHVISAGSLIEFEMQNISVPVGRVEMVYVYPLSFSEYLTASGKHNLREMLLHNSFNEIPQPIHSQLINEVRNYTLLGGMPEVIADFIENGEFERCRNIQTGIIETYKRDFHKYAKKHQIKYLQMVFESIPVQLGNKFKFSNISKNIKSRELGEALDLLEMAGILYKVYHSSSNGIPLKAEINRQKFKVLFFDIGLAQNILRLDIKPLLLNPDILQVNNGAIAELFTGLEFTAYSNFRERAELFYWHREAKSSNAELDYVIQIHHRIVPVEVKSSSYGRMKSLQIFIENKKSDFAVKISRYNYSSYNIVHTVPFYGIEALLKFNRSESGGDK